MGTGSRVALYAMKSAINILSIIDTGIIGGPGKGIFQLANQFRGTDVNFIICGFSGRNRGRTEFETAVADQEYRFYALKERIRFDPFVLWQTYKIIRDNRIDILQTHGYKGNTIVFCLRAVLRIPWISFAHGWTSEDFKVRFYNRFDKWLLKYADRVIAVSKKMKQDLAALAIAPERIEVINNAIDAEASPPVGGPEVRREHGIDEESPVIGVIGRLSSEKGQKDFIDAFVRVLSRQPRAVALLVGNGPDRARLEQYAHDLGILKHMVFAGHRTDIARHYAAIDIGVIPSLSEGMPNVALEALAYERPLVATSVGGVPEVVTDGEEGLLVPPGDIVRMADAIIRLLEDESLRRKLVRAGRRKVGTSFSPSHRAHCVLQVYEKVLQGTEHVAPDI